MGWKDKFLISNRTFADGTVLFGGHYTEAQEIIQGDKYGGIEKVKHVWIRFCFISDEDGGVIHGWLVLHKKPDSMRGCIEGTVVEVWK